MIFARRRDTPTRKLQPRSATPRDPEDLRSTCYKYPLNPHLSAHADPHDPLEQPQTQGEPERLKSERNPIKTNQTNNQTRTEITRKTHAKHTLTTTTRPHIVTPSRTPSDQIIIAAQGHTAAIAKRSPSYSHAITPASSRDHLPIVSASSSPSSFLRSESAA